MVDELTKRGWEIAEELGMPVPEHMELYESLCDELREHCWPEYYLTIANLAVEWLSTRNPHFLDAAMMICSGANIPITPTLQRELTAASKLRFEGSPAGTADKVKKKQIRTAALIIMANLRHTGLSVPEAANIAEIAVKEAYKADSLAKFYNQEIKPALEAEYHANWERTTPHHKKMWQTVAKGILSGKVVARAVSDS